MRRTAVPLVSALLLAAACDDANVGRGCEALAEPCDITKASCQRAVFEVTACIRQQEDAQLPPIRVITRDELKDELRASLEDDEPSADETAEDRSYALLGLVPQPEQFDDAYVDTLGEGIAAYYTSRDKRITIIADAADDADDGTYVLSHELVHALQDQRDGFRAVYEDVDSTDAVVAVDSLIEGEATFLSTLAMVEIYGRDPKNVAFGTIFEEMLQGVLADIDVSPAPLLSAFETLPYPVGGAGVWNAWLDAGGLAGIERFYDEPPSSLASWFETTMRVLPEPLACALPAPPEGFDSLGTDRLGAMGLVALGAAQGFDGWATARRWTGDSIATFANADRSEALLAWRIRLQDGDDAFWLGEALRGMGEGIEATVDGPEVLIVAAEDATRLDGWDARFECAAPVPTKARSERALLAARRRLELMR